MEIELLFKIAAIRNNSSCASSSASKSWKRRPSYDDYAYRACDCACNGGKGNKWFI